MNDYILQLKTKDNIVNFELSLKNADNLLSDYIEKAHDIYVYNDYEYYFSVINKENEHIDIEYLFINNEMIEDRSFLSGRKSLFAFLECFGIVKIEVIIDGIVYVTNNIHVAMREDSINTNILNMIDYIYENCDNYLYEEHKNSKIGTGVNPHPNISIDTKLSLLNEIYDVYVRSYNILKYRAQTKLINANKIGDFNELQGIKQNTINYIVNHPEELQPVNYNSGIVVNKQYYQPRKTLVQSVVYSYDIYENQVIVSFLKRIIDDLEEIKSLVDSYKKHVSTPYKKNGYIDSSYYIYTRNTKLLNDYSETIESATTKFQKLFIEYKRLFNVQETVLISLPQYTNIFRRIMPYNIMFEKILKWFNCGNYNLAKSDLLLSFVSVSKIYEYFCLLKINRSFEKCGYVLENGFSFKYSEKGFYRNTIYNNTFLYQKDGIEVTIYYQPIIYGKTNSRDRPNNIALFRNTSISIDSSIFNIIDDKANRSGNTYTPDYLIKIHKQDMTNYYILDAKHSSSENIKRHQLPYLVYKYLFSISRINSGEKVDGMCILCGKTQSNGVEDIHDIANSFNIQLSPSAVLCQLSGVDVNDDNDLVNYIKTLERKFLKN